MNGSSRVATAWAALRLASVAPIATRPAPSSAATTITIAMRNRSGVVATRPRSRLNGGGGNVAVLMGRSLRSATAHHESQVLRFTPSRGDGESASLHTHVVNLIEELRRVVGDQHVLVDPELRSPYERDFTGRYGGDCQAVVRPADATQVAEVVRLCAEHGAPVVPQGGTPAWSEAGSRAGARCSSAPLA